MVKMTQTTVVVGTQWGDEGKGKIVDFLSEKADMVVRYNGGSNAGHTVVLGDKKIKLQQLPSGIIRNKTCIIGNGCVLDLDVIQGEIEQLTKQGVSKENISKNLFISERAHLIFPYHKVIDELQNNPKSKPLLTGPAIGTTGRGIGPCYSEKSARRGLRASDLRRDDFPDRVKENFDFNKKIVNSVFNEDIDFGETKNYQDRSKNFAVKNNITDTSKIIHDYFQKGKKIIFEGAQATFLDLDHGTYPFVSSSNSTAGYANTGAGVVVNFDNIVGIAKAYTTRVGQGPFPTELTEEKGDGSGNESREESKIQGKKLRDNGNEYGTVTGRPRRCGWLDFVMLNYSKRINGLTGIVLTKLDVLDDFDKIKICTAYKINGKVTTDFPSNIEDLKDAEPQYIELDGWNEKIDGIKDYDDLPKNARIYLEKIEKLTGLKIFMVSTGPDRESTIIKESIW